MSSTPVRRTGSSKRPITARPAAEPAIERERAQTNAFSRAFALPHFPTFDTLFVTGLLLLGLVLRLIMLGDRALHHDESLHATYSWYLMGRDNPQYYYDPMMHGPLQFHMIAFFYSIFGSSPFAARLWSVTCGTALIAVPLLLYRQLGRWVTYTLMALLCFSPIALYFSRFAREDMQYALFTFLMMAALLRYVLDRRDGNPFHYRWLYVLAIAFVMAYAAKESIYLTTAVLGAFLGAQLGLELLEGAWWAGPAAGVALLAAGALTGSLALAALGALVILAVLILQVWVSEKTGLVAEAMRDTPWTAWLLSGAIIAIMFVLLYWPIGAPVSWAFIPGAHPVNTTLDIPGKASQPFTYSTDGLIGGLQYWQAQQPVARGGQPWYYYLFVIPLYEWLIVPFGIVGGIYILMRRRTMLYLLLLWWTVASFMLYGYTSEKMPWNALHLTVPLATLAAVGLVAAVTHWRRWVRNLAIAAAAILAFFSVHNALTLSYVNGADPVEYMVYVQTAPDVPAVYSEMQRLQQHLGGLMHLQVDNDDTWPWAFYLRDPSKWYIDAYPSSAQAFGVPTQPVLLVGDANYQQLATSLAPNYVAFREILRWWDPEEYKTYAERLDSNYKPLPRLDRAKYFLEDLFSPSSWLHIFQWEIQRRPFTSNAWVYPNNQLDFYFVVKKDLVPYLSPHLQQLAQQQIIATQQQDPFITRTRTLQARTTYGQGGLAASAFSSAGPIASDAHGDLLVGDLNNYRVVVLAPNGSVLHSFGSLGSGPGQFSNLHAPSIGGIAVGPNGNIYVADTWNYRVQEFTPDGHFIRQWGHPSPDKETALQPYDFYGPRGIAVAPNGNVYVADTGNRRIQVFDPNGRFLFTFGSPGILPGHFAEPSGVTVGQDGRVYVADYWNHRIQVLSATGQPIKQFAVTAWQNTDYNEPQIAVDSANRIYAPDFQHSRVLVFDASGKPLFAWGQLGKGPGQLTNPLAVASTGAGILVNDSGNSRIVQYALP